MFRKVVWSVKDVKTGLVIDRSANVVISGARLKVSQAGRNRVLLERRKNVHAGICGVRIKRAPKGNWLRAQYNPYKNDTFILTDSGLVVTHARYAKLTPKGLFVLI